MNIKYEKLFVEKFISKNKRHRILYELQNEKKRQNGIGRFCHATSEYILDSKIVYLGNSISNQEINSLIRKYTKEEQCYIISEDWDIDGIFIEREKALDTIIGRGGASIMVFSNLVVIETEQEVGSAMKYILYSD